MSEKLRECPKFEQLGPTRRGVWFQSQSGFWYRKRQDAGVILAVSVDGHIFRNHRPTEDRLEAENAELRKRVGELEVVLKAVEWSDSNWPVQGYCPECERYRGRGHKKNCIIGKAIAAKEGE